MHQDGHGAIAIVFQQDSDLRLEWAWPRNEKLASISEGFSRTHGDHFAMLRTEAAVLSSPVLKADNAARNPRGIRDWNGYFVFADSEA